MICAVECHTHSFQSGASGESPVTGGSRERKTKTMNIKDILAKLIKKEDLTDEEKAFVDKFDLQAELDRAAAAARKKSEADTKTAKAEAETLKAQIAELTQQLEEKGAAGKKADSELQKLLKKVEALEKKNSENEAKLAASARMDAIVELAKANGIKPAEGISGSSLEKLLDLAVGQTDVTDEDAMKAVFDAFKAENPSMIAAAVKGGATVKGKQADNSFAGVPNPWKKESLNLTKQIEISMKNPELANTMKSEAGVADNT